LKKQGRPTKLTAELQEQILRGLRLGNFIATMCSCLNLNKSTYYDWIKRGSQEQEGRFRDFKVAVEQAHADCETRLLMQISLASKTDWMASSWKLERKFPKRYSLRSSIGDRNVYLLPTPKKGAVR
jgi:transposase